ncbi:hypothetical protein [Variovorax sp. DT-64]|uniref:hypothetical protein n=1 Tax=Variovorax sp. DT-64 TaxID=3396160 RepID=UPI003F1A3DC9
MKFSYLTACLLSIALGASSTAFSAPPLGGSPVTKHHTTRDYAQGAVCVSGACSGFIAETKDANGVLTGTVEAYYLAGPTLTYLHCEGPEYANILSINPGNGATTVNATLDPSAPGCTGTYGATLHLSFTGTPDGTYSSTTSGDGKSEVPGSTHRYRFNEHVFSEAFTGTNGFITGVMPGTALSHRITNITKVK